MHRGRGLGRLLIQYSVEFEKRKKWDKIGRGPRRADLELKKHMLHRNL